MANTPFQPPDGYELDDLFSRQRKARKRKRRAPPVFADLPLRARRDLAVSMGWRIRSYPDGGGQFVSHDYIPGDRKWPVDGTNGLACQWADIFFVGREHRRRGVFYNATIETLAQHVSGKIENEADDMLQSRMGGDDPEDGAVYSKKTSIGHSMIFGPRKPIDAFGGLTRDGKLAEMIEDLVAAMEERKDLQGFAKFESDYCNGIGLHMVVPEAGLTVDNIAKWIVQFREGGEAEVQWDCQGDDRIALVARVRSLLARKAWALRRRQASDLGMDEPEEPTDPVGLIMACAASNAIKV